MAVDDEDERTIVVARSADEGDDGDHTVMVARASGEDEAEAEDHTVIVARGSGDTDDGDHTVVVARGSGDADDGDHTVVVARASEDSDHTVVVGRSQKKASEPSLTLPATSKRRRGIAPPPVVDGFAPPAVDAMGPGAVVAYTPRAITESPTASVPTTGAGPTRDLSTPLPSVAAHGYRNAQRAWWGFWVSLVGAAAGVGLIVWGIMRLAS